MIPEKNKCYFINYQNIDDFGYIGEGTYTGIMQIFDGTTYYLFKKLRSQTGFTGEGYFPSDEIIREIDTDYSI